MPRSSRSRPCGTDPESLSALVDGALDDADREELLTHLTGCPGCRAEAEELRRVRDLLGSTRREPSVPAPSELSRRLVEIAGQQAGAPLWTRPFDPARRPTALPMRHRVVRRRLGSVGVLAAVLVLTLGTVGWTAAPEAGAPVDDPAGAAQEFFGAALTQSPMRSEGMAALVLSGVAADDALRGRGEPSPGTHDLRRDLPITAEEALVVLRTSAVVDTMLPRVGVQEVRVRVGEDEVVAADVDVLVQPGQSTQVAVSAPGGERLGSGSLPVAEATTSVELVAATHSLGGFLRAATVAGRTATVVEARVAGALRARWWVDAETGLLLRSERYDVTGATVASTGYRSVEVGTDAFSPQLAPRLATFTGSATVALSQAPALSAQGWSCDDELADLPLVQLRTGGDGALHSAYSDGVRTVAVTQHRGVLAGPPVGFTWDEGLAAWRSTDSLPAQLVWQSGDRVITVTTDSVGGTVWEAVAQLPHDEPEYRTPLGRVLEGWQRVTSLVLAR